MIHQNRCQSWKSLSVYLLTSQWVSQSATKQMGAQWLKFSGFFAALVTHIPFCALCWQVEPWTAGKLKLFITLSVSFAFILFLYCSTRKKNQWFQLLQTKRNQFMVHLLCSVTTPARTFCSGRNWFGTVCTFASGGTQNRNKRTNRQAGEGQPWAITGQPSEELLDINLLFLDSSLTPQRVVRE